MLSALITRSLANASDTDQNGCKDFIFPHNAFKRQSDPGVYSYVSEITDTVIYSAGFTKFTNVFGIPVVGVESVKNDKILHVSNILSLFLDQDQDGTPDNEGLIKSLVSSGAGLYIVENADMLVELFDGDKLWPEEMRHCPFALDFEISTRINPGSSFNEAQADCRDSRHVDRSLAFVSDFFYGRGFKFVVPHAFIENHYHAAIEKGYFDGSATACAVGSFEECHLVLYTSWSITSYLDLDYCWCKTSAVSTHCNRESIENQDMRLLNFLKSFVFPKNAQDLVTLKYNPKSLGKYFFKPDTHTEVPNEQPTSELNNSHLAFEYDQIGEVIAQNGYTHTADAEVESVDTVSVQTTIEPSH